MSMKTAKDTRVFRSSLDFVLTSALLGLRLCVSVAPGRWSQTIGYENKEVNCRKGSSSKGSRESQSALSLALIGSSQAIHLDRASRRTRYTRNGNGFPKSLVLNPTFKFEWRESLTNDLLVSGIHKRLVSVPETVEPTGSLARWSAANETNGALQKQTQSLK
jgi:hypothetical protein